MASSSASLGTIVLITSVNTLRRLALAMTNPFGDDETDYELDYDLRRLWSEAQQTMQRMPEDDQMDQTIAPPREVRHRSASGEHAGGWRRRPLIATAESALCGQRRPPPATAASQVHWDMNGRRHSPPCMRCEESSKRFSDGTKNGREWRLSTLRGRLEDSAIVQIIVVPVG